MKKLMFLFVVAILVIAGCSKDDSLYQNPNNVELKKAKVPIPINGQTWSDPDPQSNNKYFMGGTASHVGNINAEQSFYEFYTIDYIEIDGLPYYDLTGYGKVVAANGDSFEFKFSTKQSLTDYSLVSKSVITPGSGTGKFKGVSGSWTSVGGLDVSNEHLFAFSMDGEIVFE